jgi:hypothetical protein
MNDQLRADFARIGITKLDHFGELVACIDVQERKRYLAGIEGLLRQPQHHRGVLADRIQHDRTREFGCGFPQDVDAFGLQGFEVR